MEEQLRWYTTKYCQRALGAPEEETERERQSVIDQVLARFVSLKLVDFGPPPLRGELALMEGVSRRGEMEVGLISVAEARAINVQQSKAKRN